MLDYADGWAVGNKSFPNYWSYQYNSNPDKLIKKILSLKLLTVDASLLTNMNSALIKDLKQLLRENELKLSGNKSELIERLIGSVPNDELQKIFNQEKYILTDEGRKILEKNDHIKFFHSYGQLGVSIHRAHAIRKENPEFSKYDIAHKQLDFSSEQHINDGNWGLYRNDRHGISVVLDLENKLLESLKLLFEVCYYDLSGTSNNFNLDFIDIYEEYFFPYDNSNHTLALGIISKMQDIQDRLAISDKQFSEIGLEHIKKITTPIHLFTKHEVLEIIISEMNADKEKIKKTYRKAQSRYKKEGIQCLLTIQLKY